MPFFKDHMSIPQRIRNSDPKEVTLVVFFDEGESLYDMIKSAIHNTPNCIGMQKTLCNEGVSRQMGLKEHEIPEIMPVSMGELGSMVFISNAIETVKKIVMQNGFVVKPYAKHIFYKIDENTDFDEVEHDLETLVGLENTEVSFVVTCKNTEVAQQVEDLVTRTSNVSVKINETVLGPQNADELLKQMLERIPEQPSTACRL